MSDQGEIDEVPESGEEKLEKDIDDAEVQWRREASDKSIEPDKEGPGVVYPARPGPATQRW